LRPYKYVPLSNKIEITYQPLAWKVGKVLKNSYRVLLLKLTYMIVYVPRWRDVY